MKTPFSMAHFLAGACLLPISTTVWAQAEPPAPNPTNPAAPSTYCRFVPERSDDFAWENDLVAFRAYGPALRKAAEDSGIDCWTKRVPYPIIDKWYRLDHEQKLSYHADRGEGHDFYHVGRSRGCGGTAIWINGKMVLSDVFKEWKILESAPKKSVFQLTYDYAFDGRKIRELKTITLELGQRLFKSESVFTENDRPAALEIAIGVSTQNGRGLATMNKEAGWLAVWQDYGKSQLGTGLVIDPQRVIRMEEIKSARRDESHAIVVTSTDAAGRTLHYAGFAWTLAGGITTPGQWQDYLVQVATPLRGKTPSPLTGKP